MTDQPKEQMTAERIESICDYLDGVRNPFRTDKEVRAAYLRDIPDLLRYVEGLEKALRGLVYLTDQGREGGLILSRYDRKPITNGDQAVIDRAYIAAEAALASSSEIGDGAIANKFRECAKDIVAGLPKNADSAESLESWIYSEMVSFGLVPPAGEIGDGWVKCAEKMPDDKGFYLVYDKNGMGSQYFQGSYFLFDGDPDLGITHWAKLPSPPENGR